VGIELYFKPQDMYPGVIPKWGGLGLMFGTSLVPLANQYYIGLSVEPLKTHGITFGAGFATGSWQRLTNASVNQILGPTSLANPSETTVSAVPPPALPPTDSKFHSSAFVMIGFDFNIFQAIFGKVLNIGVPAPTGGAQ
jgi:hypothetical protein